MEVNLRGCLETHVGSGIKVMEVKVDELNYAVSQMW
jgi:hypothetical protein